MAFREGVKYCPESRRRTFKTRAAEPRVHSEPDRSRNSLEVNGNGYSEQWRGRENQRS